MTTFLEGPCIKEYQGPSAAFTAIGAIDGSMVSAVLCSHTGTSWTASNLLDGPPYSLG